MAWLGNFDDFKMYEGENSGFNNSLTTTKFSIGNTPNMCHVGQQNYCNQKSTCVQKIRDISTHTTFANLTGVIIYKQEKRSIFSKKNPTTERYLFCFCLRDSASEFVNVACWGNVDYINIISEKADVGHVALVDYVNEEVVKGYQTICFLNKPVRLNNAQVQLKSSKITDEIYKPWTPVPFQISISENHGSVESYTGWDTAKYKSILCIPTRPSNDYHTLEDIGISGMAIQNNHVNILAAVRKVGPVRHFTTKTGSQTKKCDVLLFDDTCPSFSLDLWQNHADLSLMWIPFETDTQEAFRLRQFLRTQDRSMSDVDVDNPLHDADPDLSNVKEVFTVSKLIEKMKTMAQSTTPIAYYGILNALITVFDLDASSVGRLTRRSCGRCRRMLQTESCTNAACGQTSIAGAAADEDKSSIIVEYRIPVSLSDHTGTVSNCYLQPSIAELMIGCQAEIFLRLSDAQRTAMKWKYLLENCCAVFKLQKLKQGSGQLPSVQILAMERPAYGKNTVPTYSR